MGFFTRDIKTIDDLFAHGLRDIYYAEHQIMQSLPDMIEKAHDPQLKQRLVNEVLGTALRDNVKARLLHSDGHYERAQRPGPPLRSQMALLETARATAQLNELFA